jgi:hypothetical protein
MKRYYKANAWLDAELRSIHLDEMYYFNVHYKGSFEIDDYLIYQDKVAP